MAEFSAQNCFVGEDWESECYDSAPFNEVVHTKGPIFLDVSPVEQCRSSKHDDVSDYKLLSNDLASSADVESNLTEVAEDRTYVNDNKKVFVSNVNYHVSLLRIALVLRLLMLLVCCDNL